MVPSGQPFCFVFFQSFPTNDWHNQLKLEVKYSTIDMLPFMARAPAPMKMWSPALHSSFDAIKINHKVDTSWINDRCAEIVTHVKEAYGSQFNSVGRAVKMTGIVPNLRAHVVHADSEQHRLKFTAGTSLWSANAIEKVAEDKKAEFDDAKQSRIEGVSCGPASRTTKMMKNNGTTPDMLRKMDQWFQNHERLMKTQQFASLMCQPVSTAPYMPAKLELS